MPWPWWRTRCWCARHEAASQARLPCRSRCCYTLRSKRASLTTASAPKMPARYSSVLAPTHPPPLQYMPGHSPVMTAAVPQWSLHKANSSWSLLTSLPVTPPGHPAWSACLVTPPAPSLLLVQRGQLEGEANAVIIHFGSLWVLEYIHHMHRTAVGEDACRYMAVAGGAACGGACATQHAPASMRHTGCSLPGCWLACKLLSGHVFAPGAERCSMPCACAPCMQPPPPSHRKRPHPPQSIWLGPDSWLTATTRERCLFCTCCRERRGWEGSGAPIKASRGVLSRGAAERALQHNHAAHTSRHAQIMPPLHTHTHCEHPAATHMYHLQLL